LDTTTVELTECDEEITNISIPIIECPNDTSNFQLRLCFGESVDINGVIYEFESDTLLLLESATVPCKSYEVYDITVLPRVPDMAVWYDQCEGDFVEIDGVPISNDSVFSKIYQDVNGCDSIVHFVVEFAPLTREQVEFKFCPGDEVRYRDLTILTDTLFDYRIIGLSGECDTVVTIQATTFDPPMASPETLDACPDVDDGLIRVISNQTFELILNGQNLGTTNLIRNLPSGTYQLELIDLNGCELDFDLTINRKPPLEANIEEIFLECSGDMVPLIVNVSSGEDDELSIRWLNGQVGDSLLVDRPGLYFAEVRNSCQVKTIQGRATLTGVGNGVLHFVPHAFTPNGDDINDTFLTFWAEGVEFESFELEVFDRWGERQFRTNDPNIGWNGIMKGKDEKVAVYVWKLNARVRYCNEIYTIVDYGDVTLLN
jgi:gliding motility-associated-like protein